MLSSVLRASWVRPALVWFRARHNAVRFDLLISISHSASAAVQGIFGVARRLYCLFQHHSNPGLVHKHNQVGCL